MVNIDLAKIDPEKEFESPQQLVDSKEISREQKIEILHQWAYDELELSVAEEENMQATEPTNRLDEVLKALHQLGASIHLDHANANKQGDI